MMFGRRRSAGFERFARVSHFLAFVAIVAAPAQAFARAQSSLGQLSVPAARVPDGYPASWFGLLDTSTWRVQTVRASNCADSASDNDGAAIQSAINSAPARTVLLLDGNGSGGACVYNIPSRLTSTRGEIVIRGMGSTRTTLKNNNPSQIHTLWVGSFQMRPVQQTSRSWTSGYSKGTSTITLSSASGIAPGTWLLLRASYPSGISFASPGLEGLTFAARAASTSGNTVTLDRALPISFATSNQQVHLWTNMVRNFGLEDLRLVDADPQNDQMPFVLFEGTVESWIRGVLFDDARSHHLTMSYSARNVVHGNVFQDLTLPFQRANNHSSVVLADATSDNVIENNAFLASVPRAITLERTATRSFVAYNFMGDPGNNLCEDLRPGGGGRSVFHHGSYTHSSIVEGNDAVCKMEVDNYWGRQGPFITYYRNRIRSGNNSSWEGMLGSEDFSGNGDQSEVNYIGNTVQYLHGSGGGPLDRDDRDTWIERNVIRQSCVLQQVNGQVTTLCGNGSNDRNAPGTRWQTNHRGAAAPTSWAGFVAPASLIYDSVPSWWCQESCPFEAAGGIGAFGDDFNTALCQLPAERLARALACTPIDDGATAPPPPPVLLP